MNFLQLVQRTRRECGISGSGPTTVSSATGEMQRLVDWVRDAYIEVQNKETHWNWLNKSDSVALTAGHQTFSPVTDFGIYPLDFNTDTFSVYSSAIGTTDIQFLAYDDYRDAKRNYINSPTSRPTRFTVLPNRDIKFNTVLDAAYTLDLDYYATAEEMNADTDTPSLPVQYHMGIVWKAVSYYAIYEDADALLGKAEAKFNSIYEQMLHTEIPKLRQGGPLA